MGILSNMKSAAGVKGDEGGSDVMRRRVGEDMSQGEVGEVASGEEVRSAVQRSGSPGKGAGRGGRGGVEKTQQQSGGR